MKTTLTNVLMLKREAETRRNEYKAKPKCMPLCPAYNFNEIAERERQKETLHNTSISLMRSDKRE